MLLTILALLVTAGDHASLHPGDADLFVCSPEVQTSLAAAKNVGLNRLLLDPEVLAFIGDEVDPVGGVESLGDAFGLDISEGELLMGSLSAFSFSVSGLDEFEAAPPLEGMGLPEALSLLMQHELLFVFEFEAPEAVHAARAIADQLLGDMAATEGSHETAAGQVKVIDYTIAPGSSERGLWTAEWGTSFAIGVGAQGAPGLISRLGGGESLASTERWAKGEAAMRQEGGVRYMTYHHNLLGDPWYSLAAFEAGPAIARAGSFIVELFFSGILPTGASEEHGTCRIVGKEYVFEVMDFSSPAREDTARLPADFLGLVNPEAIGMWSTTFDSKELTETVLELISEQTELPASTIEMEFEYSVGVTLEDLMAPLSDNIAFYMLPISGATIPRIHAVVKLDDAVAYEAAWTKLASFLKTQATPYVEVADRPYRKIPVFSLKSPASESSQPSSGNPLAGVASMGLMNPAFTIAILPDRAVLGLSPSYVKREVRRLLKEEDGAGSTHPLAESGPPCPEGVSYFGYLDWPAVLGGIYDTATAFLPLIADSAALPVDIDAMPETETITQYFSATSVWSRPGESGTYTLKRSPIGFEIALQTATLAGPFLFFNSSSTEGRRGAREVGASNDTEEVAEEVRAEPVEDPDKESRQRTRLVLQEVKLGLVIYKSENGSFPESLEALLAPTQSYPKGFLNSDTLPKDGWDGPLFYGAQKEDGGYRLWSAGPDGVDNGGGGDDVPSR